MPTIATVLDAKDGFWQKKLDRESSYKTTGSKSLLDVIVGYVCLSASVALLGCGNEPCTGSSRDCMA